MALVDTELKYRVKLLMKEDFQKGLSLAKLRNAISDCIEEFVGRNGVLATDTLELEEVK